ncbi:MAG: ADP-ribosylglycohydrolase family protein [Clostridia bacterium]|nr:ADP-ribosylglycohydrolase family protein [Clostridia bacterium]
MIGAIIGDIAGSRFEFDNYRHKDFKIFSHESFFTDDSVMTLAIAKAILSCEGDYRNLSQTAIYWMQKVGREYPVCGYGSGFFRWMFTNNPKPYGSCGNGSAMRVSACGWFGKTLEEVKDMSYKVTAISHDHPEGIKGAEATAVCVFLAREGKDKEYIREYINEHYYKLDFTIAGIMPTYKFDGTCQGTVPQALECFLESENFEDCVRTCVALGGDCDTSAAIACAVAEAYYGVPEWMRDSAEKYLDPYLLDILREVEKGLTDIA